MIPVITQIDTDQVAEGLKLVSAQGNETEDQNRSRARPELRKAIEDSWKHNEAAYRYLGR